MGQWIPLPLSQPLYANADESAVVSFQAAIENGFINDFGGHSRFPGLKPFAELPDKGRVYLHDQGGDLIAATSRGNVYSCDPRGNVSDRTGIQVSGGRRVIFAKTGQELTMAAGGPIVRLRDRRTEILADAAPLASHVQWLDNYTIAAEINSGRFYHSAAGLPDSWDPLDTLAADGDPDAINAIMVTPFRELMVGGRNSLEQFESSQGGDAAFFRRWAVGEGVGAPYAMLFAANATWSVNKQFEVVKSAGQVAESASTPIGLMLAQVDNWDDAWMGGFPDKPLHVLGQQFILLQIPHATNPYGSKGITLLHDYRKKHWYTLYAFDQNDGIPVRWPGWSHWPLWTRTFVGGEGMIYEIDPAHFTLAGAPQRWLVRTSHLTETNQAQIDRLRLHLKRGLGGNVLAPSIAVRCRRDGRAFGNWVHRSLGRAGESVPILDFGSFGTAHAFQFEITTSDDAPVELLKAEISVQPVGH